MQLRCVHPAPPNVWTGHGQRSRETDRLETDLLEAANCQISALSLLCSRLAQLNGADQGYATAMEEFDLSSHEYEIESMVNNHLEGKELEATIAFK